MNIASVAFCVISTLIVNDYAVASSPPNSVSVMTDSNRQADENYSNGLQAIDQSHWSRAESQFNRVIDARGRRADGALYWKSYALFKEGRGADALAACSQLRQIFPQSHWLDDCGALEIEIRDRSNRPVPPQSEPDPDLKLLALSSLMRTHESEALPILQKILVGHGTPKLKQRALFVLAQGTSQESQDLMVEIARGKVAPDLQMGAVRIVGARRNSQADRELSQIYQRSNDVHVKEAVLESYLSQGNRGQLLKVANTESNLRLVRTATRALGVMGDSDDLLTLYRNSEKPAVKASVIDAIVAGAEEQAMIAIIDFEKDPILHQNAIRALGRFQDQSSGSILVNIYRKNRDLRSRRAAIDALFARSDRAHLEMLLQQERDPALMADIQRRLNLLHEQP